MSTNNDLKKENTDSLESSKKRRRINENGLSDDKINNNLIEHSELGNLLVHMHLDEDNFINLLSKLIGVVETLQNNPQQGLIPRENNASDIVLERLSEYNVDNGGVLEIERVEYVEGRGNLIIKYPGTDPTQTISFVGSHMDVVPANPELWDVNPFELTRQGDKLYGRGTTDCLGHVALLTELMVGLATLKPALKHSVICIFIANEEASTIHGIGVDALVKDGRMEPLKNGPLFWIDSADSQPCIGTAGIMQWSLKANGKLFHSGLPHRAINSIELGYEALKYIQNRFYEDYPMHELEEKYNFLTPSTIKATKIESDVGSLNQIPGHCSISGDIRLTPFYDVDDVRNSINKYVDELNNDITILPTIGPVSKYILEEENITGRIEIEWIFEGENGIACDLESVGHEALFNATKEIMGDAVPFSICGSLPIVRFLKDHDFDVQIAGYGLSSRYHADNEYCQLSDMGKALEILGATIAQIEEKVFY